MESQSGTKIVTQCMISKYEYLIYILAENVLTSHDSTAISLETKICTCFDCGKTCDI